MKFAGKNSKPIDTHRRAPLLTHNQRCALLNRSQTWAPAPTYVRARKIAISKGIDVKYREVR